MCLHNCFLPQYSNRILFHLALYSLKGPWWRNHSPHYLSPQRTNPPTMLKPGGGASPKRKGRDWKQSWSFTIAMAQGLCQRGAVQVGRGQALPPALSLCRWDEARPYFPPPQGTVHVTPLLGSPSAHCRPSSCDLLTLSFISPGSLGGKVQDKVKKFMCIFFPNIAL